MQHMTPGQETQPRSHDVADTWRSGFGDARRTRLMSSQPCSSTSDPGPDEEADTAWVQWGPTACPYCPFLRPCRDTTMLTVCCSQKLQSSW